MEIWKPVVGFEGYYEVSNLGAVRRIKPGGSSSVGRCLTPDVGKLGYCRVTLCRSATDRKRLLVHRVVAEAFIGPCPDRHEVNHKDGIRGNNRADNLEYATRSENHRHSFRELGRVGPRGEVQGQSKLTPEQITEIKRLSSAGTLQREIAKRFGITRSNVSLIVNGHRWAHHQSGDQK